MNKIFAFIIVTPFIALLLFKAVAFYEYDTKQRYMKNIIDSVAYNVKITGRLDREGYDNLKISLNKLGTFNDSDIVMRKGYFGSDGTLMDNMSVYGVNEQLSRGDAFAIYIKSSGVSNYSRIQNGGVAADDTKNLYFKAKAFCRVEKNN